MFFLTVLLYLSLLSSSEGLLLPIFRELGMVWNPYDYEGGLIRQGDPDSLDPIDPSLPGCINVHKLFASAQKLKVDVITDLAESLESAPGFMKHVKPNVLELIRPGAANGRVTNRAFAACLAVLTTSLLLTDVTTCHMQILCFFTFFTVAKSNGMLRAIFDCRALGKVSASPPKIRLAPVPDAMQEAAKLGARYMVNCDLKHYFFQLGLPNPVKRLFGCKCDGSYYVSNSVAMGFSWSPAWSMMATLLLILHTETCAADRLGVRVKELRRCPHVPGTINLYDKHGQRCGFIVVYYDNIGIFVRDGKMAYDWADRLRANARHFGHKFKEMEIASPMEVHDLIKFDEEGQLLPEMRRRGDLVSFLGVEVDLLSPDHPFRWRHSAKKLEKWLLVFESVPSTARDVARVVGILMWNTMIHLAPLAEISNEVDMLRDVSVLLKNKSDWDKPFVDLPRDLSINKMAQWRSMLAENPWISVEHLTGARTVFLASDGTEESIAGVLLNEQGLIIDHFGAKLPHSHVYIKEVLAAYMTIMWAHKKLPRVQGWSEYRIAIDSTSAAAAVGRCYSSNNGVNRLLMNMWKFAQCNKIVIRPVDIFTDWNVADKPSRGRAPTLDLAQQTIEVLKGAPSRPDAPHEMERPSGYLPSINGIEVPDYLETVQDDLWQRISKSLHFNEDEDVVFPGYSSRDEPGKKRSRE